jgi:hypothetical protein
MTLHAAVSEILFRSRHISMPSCSFPSFCLANILPFNSITLCSEEGCIVFWQVFVCGVIDIGVDKSASKTSCYN